MRNKGVRITVPIIASLSLTGLLVSGCGPRLNNSGNRVVGPSQTSNSSHRAPANSASGSSSGQSNQTGQATASSNSAAGSTNASQGRPASGTAGKWSGWPQVGQWLPVSVKRIAELPQGILGNALALAPDGTPISVGGYTGQVSITNVYRLLPTVTTVANLPQRTHDAAVGFIGNTLYVFGGGQAASYNTVVSVTGGVAKNITTLSRPLSDAVSVPLNVGGQQGLALVGGYDGSVFRTDVAFMSVGNSGTGSGSSSQAGTTGSSAGRSWKKLLNLATPVRYPAVAASQNMLYIAGGLSEHGLSNHVYAWHVSGGPLQSVVTLPQGIQKAALFVAGPYLILVGGETADGQPINRIVEIDTRTGSSKVVGNFPTPIADMGYTQSNKTGYIAGGITTGSDMSAARAVYEIDWKQ